MCTCYCFEVGGFIKITQIWNEAAGKYVADKNLVIVDEIGFYGRPVFRALSITGGGGQQ